MSELLQQVRETLIQQGVDFNKEIIELSSGACNQVICRNDHPLAGYSIRDLLKIWHHETGQPYRETHEEYE